MALHRVAREAYCHQAIAIVQCGGEEEGCAVMERSMCDHKPKSNQAHRAKLIRVHVESL